MPHILLAYSTTDGHTRKICQRLQQLIEGRDQRVTLFAINDATAGELSALDPGQFDKIVIGASIHYGKHHKKVNEFISLHQPVLERKANAFFTVNVVARKPEKNTPDSNPYLKKFLRKITWKPAHLAVFAGRIEYRRYGPLDRFMIRLIMRLTGGPTAPDTDVEYTDWARVDDFAQLVCKMQ
ncbi:MAG: menaquinone-dependent protoporphyrinogen IX dehydrogenase [Gallionella sp.]|nr:menaquinone-dependent protoporphyrinogen IX dehydrogenase [Gallionella sp.]MDD4946070.1 menaquinone-dependent protoporphyrinogen IX dehydrogenase [Gallionella sp.]MDD5613190.1 menaquinone-dependent protoporphyrinogen IX dehydrogenase [Gallionella sp.]